jgi:hypothetical protein
MARRSKTGTKFRTFKSSSVYEGSQALLAKLEALFKIVPGDLPFLLF